jgi:hypothetical protein
MIITEANHILRLTDAQLAQVRQAAGLLPVESRDAFLRAVAHRLGGHNPTNDDVDAAIIAVLADAGIDAPWLS